MTGIEIIARERQRQIADEGCTADHDDYHRGRELARAGASYAFDDGNYDYVSSPPDLSFPWRWEWKPGAPIRMLAKAGALIAAEIDRRLRAGERDPSIPCGYDGCVLPYGHDGAHYDQDGVRALRDLELNDAN